MRKSKPKYVFEDMDRHGNVRIYFRRKGQPKIRLPSPADEKFAQAYKQALADTYKPDRATTQGTYRRAQVGSLRHLCEAYYGSAEFKQLGMRTQWVRRSILDGFSEKHGDKPINRLEPRHLRDLRNELSSRPEAANALLKALRRVFAIGVELGLVEVNPVKEVQNIRTGFRAFLPGRLKTSSGTRQDTQSGQKRALHSPFYFTQVKDGLTLCSLAVSMCEMGILHSHNKRTGFGNLFR